MSPQSSPAAPAGLRARLAELTLRDEHRLRSRVEQAERGAGRGPDRGGAGADAANRGAEAGRRRDGRGRDSLEEVTAAIEAAEKRVSARIAARPPISYPAGLPVSGRRDDIAKAIAENQVVIVAGETGSGKTTQIPKICLELGRGVRGMVGHTQPRRIAARTVAERIASELGVELGGAIGYQVRFTSQVADDTLVKVMTDGILLAEIQRDKMLRAYDTIIIDEAHERSLNIDFILGYLKQLLPKRPDLKVIITSATIDPGKFSAHFDDAPIIEVSGRTYPVEIRYRPLVEEDEGEDDESTDDDALASRTRDQTEAIQEAVAELLREPTGDILVFLSGEREIRDTADALQGYLAARRNAAARPVEVIPLFARLSSGEQHRVFQPHTTQRIVLATNVAETSLTVPGIRYVIDTGTARISRYSTRTKVQRLPIERISQASANQRSGRCGRTSDGICIRLFGEEDFLSRPEFTDPEILRTNLASVILQMAALGFARSDDDLAGFPFLQPPDARAIKDGRTLLLELGALTTDDDGGTRLTDVGRSLSKLPIDPRLARMVVEAEKRGVAAEVTIIAAGLSIQDPRERPEEHREAATTKHRRFAHEHSDFLTLLNLWGYLQEKQRELGSSQFRKLCRAEFLNFMRVREWQDLTAQLRQMAKGEGIRIGEMQWSRESGDAATGGGTGGARPGGRAVAANRGGRGPRTDAVTGGVAHGVPVSGRRQGGRSSSGPGGIVASAPAAGDVDVLGDEIHRSLLAGLLTQIGLKNAEKNEYLGPRGTKFAVFPGSGLFKKPPRWLMAAELVETSRLWARVNARIDPAWVEELGGVLLKRTYSEPHWEKKAGAVMAYEKVTLYGVPIVASRKVNYGRIDPVLGRELFIRNALVEGDWVTRHAFFHENRRLIQDIEELESRTRRRDLLVDEETLFAFYDERVGREVVSGRHFDSWWKTARSESPDLLDFSAAMLLADPESAVNDEDYPRGWPLPDGSEAELRYQFEPGTDADGVTVILPVDVLNQIDETVFSWQIPGLRQDLYTALIRSLPKPLRRHFVPAPDVARRIGGSLEPYVGDVRDALAAELSEPGGVELSRDDFDLAKMPDHLLMTFRIVDAAGGKTLREGKDLAQLRGVLTPDVQETLSAAAVEIERRGMTTWDLGELPEVFDSGRGGRQLRGYPALIDDGASVSVRVLDRAASARTASWYGLRRLLFLGVASPSGYVQSHLSNQEKLTFARAEGGVAALLEDCVLAAIDRLMLESGLDPDSEAGVRDERAFEQLRIYVSDRLVDTTFEVVKLVERVLSAAARIDREISGTKSLVLLPALTELRAQIAELTGKGFVAGTGWAALQHVPRYLSAAEIRLKKLPENPGRDRQFMDRVAVSTAEYRKALSRLDPGVPPSTGLRRVRWMLEELRVSFYAQELGTPYPVSEKRISKALAAG